MSTPYANVNFKYRHNGYQTWHVSIWAGLVNQQSETLVMQKLRDAHKNCEIVLIAIKWK